MKEIRMNLNFRFLTAIACVFLILASACKSTNKVSDQEKEQAASAKLSPADLAQLRDNHKLNPDNAIVSGAVVEMTDAGIVVKITKLEKQGFGFSEALSSGSTIAVSGGDIKKLKQGDTVLLVISVIRMPGADTSYNLEKILAAM